ncbi:MAG: YfhO family protein [Proteobacteria bacterium]|nr:YfhO family protein [Pseudomonadota bacterium]
MIKRFINKYLLLITVILVVTMWLLIYHPFVFGKYFYLYGDIGDDTISYAYPYCALLVNKIKSFNFSSFSFAIGAGNSIFSIFAFLLDPFIWVLCIPKLPLYDGILLISFLKTVTISIIFYYYLKLFINESIYLIFGVLIYSFSSYLVVWGQHWFFQTGFLFFTFFMFGVEAYLKQNRYVLFIFSVFCLFVGTLYFAFYVSVFFIFYYFIRLSFDQSLRKIRKNLTLILFFIVGVVLASFAVLPVFDILSNSPRTQVSFSLNFLFSLPFIYTFKEVLINFSRMYSPLILGINYYKGIFNFYEDFQLYTTILCPILLVSGLAYLFLQKIWGQNKLFITSFILCLLPLFFPIISFLFNKFSANYSRYAFFYSLLEVLAMIYILKYRLYNLKSIIFSFVINLLFFLVVCYKLKLDFNFDVIIVLLFLAAYSFTILCIKKKMFFTVFMLVLIELFVVNYRVVFNQRTPFSTDNITQKNIYFDGTEDLIRAINHNDTGFFRIYKNYFSRSVNDAAYFGFYSFDTYNSLGNKGYFDFRNALGINNGYWNENNKMVENTINFARGLGNNIFLYTLLNTKYYISNEINANHPYGYSKLFSYNNYSVYKNNLYLPIGVYFDNNQCISDKDFLKQSMSDRQKILFNNIIINECNNKLSNNYPPLYNLNNLSSDKYLIKKVSGANNDTAIYEIHFLAPQSDLNLSLNINNIDIEADIYIKTLTNKGFIYKRKISQYTGESNNNLSKLNIVLDYDAITDLRLIIPQNVNVSLNNIKLSKYNYDNYISTIEQLRKHDINLNYDSVNNEFAGKLTSKTNGYILLTIPYDKYWKSLINGVEVNLKKCDIGLTCIPIKPGNNNIKVYYCNSALRTGIVISISGLVIILFMLLFRIFLSKRACYKVISNSQKL